jgi:biotin carboxyl carrier protein
MDDLDPNAAESLDGLVECLRQVHLRADKPTLRTLDNRTARAKGILPGTRLEKVRLARATLSDVLSGRKFPGKAFLLTFVDACGIDLEHDRRWEQAWDRLAPRYLNQGALAEAEQLRPRLAAALAAQAEAELARQRAENAARQAHEESRSEIRRLQAQFAAQKAELERVHAEAVDAVEAERAEIRQQEEEATPIPVEVALYMPRLGEAVTEGTVTRWLKREGDRVEINEPLLELSTDKVDTELPSPVTGILSKILVAEDKTVAVGTQLAVIFDADPNGKPRVYPAEQDVLVTSGISGKRRGGQEMRVRMPQYGDVVTEGTVTRWLKREGEPVRADEILLWIATYSMGFEMPSPATGILSKILVAEDETVAVGTTLAIIIDNL